MPGLMSGIARVGAAQPLSSVGRVRGTDCLDKGVTLDPLNARIAVHACRRALVEERALCASHGFSLVADDWSVLLMVIFCAEFGGYMIPPNGFERVLIGRTILSDRKSLSGQTRRNARTCRGMSV